MEEQPSRVTIGKLLSRTKQQQRTQVTNGKFDQTYWTKGNEKTKGKNKHSRSSCYQSLEMPMNAMEFLCRSWSPLASDFLQTLSPNHQVWGLNDCGLGKQGEKIEGSIDAQGDDEKDDGDDDEVEETREKLDLAPRNRFTNMADKAWDWIVAKLQLSKEMWVSTLYLLQSPPIVSFASQKRLSVRRSFPCFLHSFTSSPNRKKMNFKPIKELLQEKSLTSFLRWHRERKKDEVRLDTAKIHAALSVAQLAAAIVGFVGMEPANGMNKEGIITRDTSMGNVIAYAAALVATACAESAESAGADKAHVASAVNSGLAAQSTADMMTLIATAATCLRGAATLKSRAITGLHASRINETVKLEAKLSIITPSGQRVDRFVSIHSRHGQLRLSLEKKYLGISMTTRKYIILNVKEEKRAPGCHLLSIKCDGGEIKLLFKDEEQSLAWMSNISSFLSCTNITMANK